MKLQVSVLHQDGTAVGGADEHKPKLLQKLPATSVQVQCNYNVTKSTTSTTATTTAPLQENYNYT